MGEAWEQYGMCELAFIVRRFFMQCMCNNVFPFWFDASKQFCYPFVEGAEWEGVNNSENRNIEDGTPIVICILIIY
jgi:hypothetical protein